MHFQIDLNGKTLKLARIFMFYSTFIPQESTSAFSVITNNDFKKSKHHKVSLQGLVVYLVLVCFLVIIVHLYISHFFHQQIHFQIV